jgi:hypothetical protein
VTLARPYTENKGGISAFPDWRQVTDKAAAGKEFIRFGLDVELLYSLCEAIGANGGGFKRRRCVELRVRMSDTGTPTLDAIKVIPCGGDGSVEKAYGWIMPTMLD